MKLKETDALIVVDVQNDFCEGGALPVNGGGRVAELMTGAAARFASASARIYATQDWHPADHESFKQTGGPWPPHGVQHTEGAQLHPSLRLPIGTSIVRKGATPSVDAYSGFLDSNLEQSLLRLGIKRVFIGGLATEYCVLHTTMDAVRLGFEAYVLTDAIAPVEVNPGDGEAALKRMEDAGARLITTEKVFAA